MDALKKARAEGRRDSNSKKKNTIGVIQEEDEDDKYASPKAPSRSSK
jgi:hypothetical protein